MMFPLESQNPLALDLEASSQLLEALALLKNMTSPRGSQRHTFLFPACCHLGSSLQTFSQRQSLLVPLASDDM